MSPIATTESATTAAKVEAVTSTNISNNSIQDLLKFVLTTMATVAFRLFGRVMDRYTSIRYGKELASTVTSLKEISDKDIFGNEVKVCTVIFSFNDEILAVLTE
jgi:hypothetical protein